MPAANHSFYLRHCYLQNDLAEGRLEIGGERLDVSKVDIPIYQLAAREDHIAPAKSVFAGARLFGGKVRFVLAGSGHIAGVINPPGPKMRYQYWTGDPPTGSLESWLEKTQEHPGSWWPDWQVWIEGTRRRARARPRDRRRQPHADRGRAGELRAGQRLIRRSLHKRERININPRLACPM